MKHRVYNARHATKEGPTGYVGIQCSCQWRSQNLDSGVRRRRQLRGTVTTV